jgi:HD-GYP domain-containing protein (c-di-GMP phosphodiesterase class II)
MGRHTAILDSEVRLLNAIADIAANAIRRAALHEQTEGRLQHLVALRSIDRAITASLDLNVTLDILLDQLTSQLGVHAADILLFDPVTQTLEFASGRGFRSSAVKRSHLHLGRGYAGRVALERKTMHQTDLPKNDPALEGAPLLTSEGFVAYHGLPLITKGQLKGVLEVFHRTNLAPDPEWFDFLEMLAGQAAIAVENAQLFEGLQRSNLKLMMAYDATIEGWSRALELRDKETEGHSQRVTEMTLRLARAMDMSESELVHVRRGALLHDIGKMGIPDAILLRPGPLTDVEWEVMRQHPNYAYQMLMPIEYLRPALDVPYCHHERWDGSGYPRGLKGEQIPLAARIFAITDVWDALRSDRPYGHAWPLEKVLQHLRDQAGKHFDPKVVETFFRLYDSNKLFG